MFLILREVCFILLKRDKVSCNYATKENWWKREFGDSIFAELLCKMMENVSELSGLRVVLARCIGICFCISITL